MFTIQAVTNISFIYRIINTNFLHWTSERQQYLIDKIREHAYNLNVKSETFGKIFFFIFI
jgi:hypothetical protein